MDELLNPLDVQKASDILRSHWEKVISGPKDFIDEKGIVEAIRRTVKGKTTSYRYALPTQVLAKVVDPSLDCRCLQVKRGGPSAFDARSFCKKVIVPFNREHGNVLGTSEDPYVSKPLRHEEISSIYRDEIKDKEGWDDLCLLTQEIENRKDVNFTEKVLDQTLIEIYRRLSEIRVSYLIPQRVSLGKVEELIERYMAEPSGGVRPEVVAYSLLKTAGKRFNLFNRVESSKATTANRMIGRVADIECYGSNNEIKLAANVKDIPLTKGMVEDQTGKTHEGKVRNLLFLAFKGIRGDEREEIKEIISKEFNKGYNVHIIESPIAEFARILLFFFEEEGRKEFLKQVGIALDQYASYEHRRRWADLLGIDA